MNRLRDLIAAADRLQQSTAFKIVASVVLLVAAIGGISTYAVMVTAPSGAVATSAEAPPPPPPPPPVSATPPATTGAPAAPSAAETEQQRVERDAAAAAQRIVDDILARRSSPANVAIGAAMLAVLGLVVIWLGLGLTYLALAALAFGLVLPLWALGLEGLAQLLLGIIALTASFSAIMQGLRLALAGSHPVLAIARNMLAEAVRMRVSVVFLVILIFGLASLPLLLDPENPLRYRVQTFLSYGSGGSYWIIATLTVFFCVASVAFEQRDKQIWQTMTKPVAPWQYLLGKWLGGAALSAALMIVCAAGVFLFTEYLRRQPALGEREGVVARQVSEDRRILEDQVLAARKAVSPVAPLTIDDQEFLDWAKLFIEDGRKIDPTFATDEATLQKVLADLYKGWEQSYRAIGPGQSRVYLFTGLGEVKRRNLPITLKYRVDAGGNMPDQLYRITFEANGVLILPPRDITLGPTQTLDLYPNLITDKGELELGVHNGAFEPVPGVGMVMRPNPETMSFPPTGLEIYYPAGSYQMNFFRVALILWIKLAFLAMLSVTAATFLSFPVASLVSFSVFLIAEGTGYLSNALEYYHATDQAGGVTLWKVPVRAVGLAITWMFKSYSSLHPTERLVDGRLLDWGHFGWGIGVLLTWCAVLFGAGVAIFRRRELATYSGQ